MILVGMKDLENGISTLEKAKAGTAGFLIELENRRAIKVSVNFIIQAMELELGYPNAPLVLLQNFSCSHFNFPMHPHI